MFSKNRLTLLLLISSIATWSFAAMADTNNDRKTVTSKAYVDTKQVKIPATTNTYTYDETNRPTADGSVVTTGAADGTVGERGIATAPTYDANDNLTNGDWLPTMGAVMNGLSQASLRFYGESTAGATDEVRNVTISGITELTPGLMIIVKPTTTAVYADNTAANAAKLNLNRLGAKPMRFNGVALTTGTDGAAWSAGTPGLWIYDGANWNYAGFDTRYSAMTDGTTGSYSGPVGTSTTSTVVSPKVLKNTVLDGITLTANTGRTAFDSNVIVNSPITSSDTLVQAFGHTQGQINAKQDKIQAGTAGNVVTYTGTAGTVGSVAVSSAATYTNDTLQNGNDIANITAVETKVSKTQSTGYQVLTTGTNGTVTADYISVPITTTGTGRPTSNNAPTGTAAIWIE